MINPRLAARLGDLLAAMDADVALALADLGLTDYRTRFSAVLRLIDRADEPGTVTIRDVADRLEVSHSGASQTVAEMARRGLIELSPGADARHRLVRLTDRAKTIMPAVDAEWDATDAASAALDAELPYPLSTLIDDLAAALERRRFRDRIGDEALRRQPAGELRDRLAGPDALA